MGQLVDGTTTPTWLRTRIPDRTQLRTCGPQTPQALQLTTKKIFTNVINNRIGHSFNEIENMESRAFFGLEFRYVIKFLPICIVFLWKRLFSPEVWTFSSFVTLLFNMQLRILNADLFMWCTKFCCFFANVCFWMMQKRWKDLRNSYLLSLGRKNVKHVLMVNIEKYIYLICILNWESWKFLNK